MGKTNLDQFACGLNGTRSPYGAVPNAFNPLYVSGGSSSGSAYVVATGQVDFALSIPGLVRLRAEDELSVVAYSTDARVALAPAAAALPTKAARHAAANAV